MAMKPKSRGLGRGLDALIQEGATRPESAPTSARKTPTARKPAPKKAESQDAVLMVPIASIRKGPWQPRAHFSEEALKELADSIRLKGVLDPVWLRPSGDAFELIAGERRYRAAQLAGLTEIPALLRSVSDLEAREMALIENLQRADLNLIEEAEGYRDLMREAGLTQEEVGRRIGKARATVANALRLLDLSDSIKRALAEGALTAGHAKVLLSAAAAQRDLLAARTIAQGLSVRALEKLVAGLPTGARPAPKKAPASPAPDNQQTRHLKFLANRIQQELGTKVLLSPARTGSDGKREMGRIVIEYFDNEDLSRLLEMLNLGDLV